MDTQMDTQMDYIPLDYQHNNFIITETEFYSLINQIDLYFCVDDVLLDETVYSSYLDLDLDLNFYNITIEEIEQFAESI